MLQKQRSLATVSGVQDRASRQLTRIAAVYGCVYLNCQQLSGAVGIGCDFYSTDDAC